MADIDRHRIKSVYGEIRGYYENLPQGGHGWTVPAGAVENFDDLMDRLTQLTRNDFSRYKLKSKPRVYNGYGYAITETRMAMAAVVRRLEDEYGFGDPNNSQSLTPVVVTVNQNQQVSITVVSLQQLIQEQDDQETKEQLQDLEDATNQKDQKKAWSVLNKIAEKSWDLFLRCLPYILERWGK